MNLDEPTTITLIPPWCPDIPLVLSLVRYRRKWAWSDGSAINGAIGYAKDTSEAMRLALDWAKRNRYERQP